MAHFQDELLVQATVRANFVSVDRELITICLRPPAQVKESGRQERGTQTEHVTCQKRDTLFFAMSSSKSVYMISAIVLRQHSSQFRSYSNGLCSSAWRTLSLRHASTSQRWSTLHSSNHRQTAFTRYGAGLDSVNTGPVVFSENLYTGSSSPPIFAMTLVERVMNQTEPWFDNPVPGIRADSAHAAHRSSIGSLVTLT